MTAKEDLVESHLTNGQQQQQQSNIPDPVDLPDEQQTPPPDYQTSIQNENEDEEIDDDNGKNQLNDEFVRLMYRFSSR